MQLDISKKKMILLMLAGMLGCVCMGASDWLMIYGDTAFEGSLAWLTLGTARIPAWRNGLAMFLAFPAVLLYCFGLFGIRYLLDDEYRRPYCFLTALGLTPWLCLHIFYTLILYLFSWLMGQGETQLAYAAGEAIFRHLGWVVLVGQIFMVLPFGYLFYLVFTHKTPFVGWMAANHPLFLYLVFTAFVGLLPDTPFRLGFINGLMSEVMLIFFGVYLYAVIRHQQD